jgi:bacterial/archaeal transporter family protein
LLIVEIQIKFILEMIKMWLLLAALSAFFAGVTGILAKCGIRKTDSTAATAVRTIVVLVMSIIIVLITGGFSKITEVTPKTWLFLVLSGLATGASWLCYFKSLSIGDINKVTAVDKSSTALTVVFAFIILKESVTWIKCVSVVLIAVGALLMIDKKTSTNTDKKGQSWLIFAVLSAVFAALTSILGKIGIEGVDSNLGTAIRTFVVLIMAWLVVGVTGKTHCVKEAPKNELIFICLSGLATGASWLCYYRALQTGPASVVAPIDKMSMLVTIAFSRIVFKEKLTPKTAVGLLLSVAGTLGMIIN